MFWYAIAFVAVLGSAVHLLPQVVRSIRTKRTADLINVTANIVLVALKAKHG